MKFSILCGCAACETPVIYKDGFERREANRIGCCLAINKEKTQASQKFVWLWVVEEKEVKLGHRNEALNS